MGELGWLANLKDGLCIMSAYDHVRGSEYEVLVRDPRWYQKACKKHIKMLIGMEYQGRINALAF